MFTVVRPVQYENASDWMVLRPDGRVIEVRAVQLVNASSSMVIRLAGRVIDFS